MGTIINYELLKEVVSRDEMIIKEQIEVEDVGNFCLRAYTQKGATEYLAINTDVAGFMTIIKMVPGSISYKHKDNYDINLIISTTQTFLKNHPTVQVISKKEFNQALDDTFREHLTLTMRKEDEEA